VQEAFITLWDKRETIDMDRPVKAYLNMMIHNKCTNHLRDTRKFDSVLLAAEELPEHAGADASEQFSGAELSVRIDAAIAELPEKCREIFLLNRYENMKYAEIAGHLNISVKTVETQVSKALQHMRIRLSEYLSLLAALLAATSGFR
jgi:RNA polymerase sigma-70 factor, ECF subfamily